MAVAIPIIGLAIAAGSAVYNAVSNEQAKSAQSDAVAKQNAAIKKAAGQQNALIDTNVENTMDSLGVTVKTAGTDAKQPSLSVPMGGVFPSINITPGKEGVASTYQIDPNADQYSTVSGQTVRKGKEITGNLNAQAGASGVIGGSGTSAGVAGQDIANTVSAQLDQIVKQADQIQANALAQKNINTTNAEAGIAVNDANLQAFNAQANASTVSGILNFGSDALSIISKSYKPTANANDYGINGPQAMDERIHLRHTTSRMVELLRMKLPTVDPNQPFFANNSTQIEASRASLQATLEDKRAQTGRYSWTSGAR